MLDVRLGVYMAYKHPPIAHSTIHSQLNLQVLSYHSYPLYILPFLNACCSRPLHNTHLGGKSCPSLSVHTLSYEKNVTLTIILQQPPRTTRKQQHLRTTATSKRAESVTTQSTGHATLGMTTQDKAGTNPPTQPRATLCSSTTPGRSTW